MDPWVLDDSMVASVRHAPLLAPERRTRHKPRQDRCLELKQTKQNRSICFTNPNYMSSGRGLTNVGDWQSGQLLEPASAVVAHRSEERELAK